MSDYDNHDPTPATADQVAARATYDLDAGTVTIPYMLLVELVDPEPCRYDHHAYCQAHGLGDYPCEHAIGQAIIGRVTAALDESSARPDAARVVGRTAQQDTT